MTDAEALDKKVNVFVEDDGTIVGAGSNEDPAVRRILEPDFPEMSDPAALDVVTQLQHLLDPYTSMLAQVAKGQEQMIDQMHRLQERMNAYEAEARKAEQDREKWFAELKDRADKMRVAPAQQEKIKANELQRMQANISAERAKLQQKLREEEQVTVTHPGRVIIARKSGGAPQPYRVPLTVSIAGLKYVIDPDRPTKVPKSVAQRVEQIKAEDQEQEARKRLLDASSQSKKDLVIAPKWEEIGAQYSRADAFRLGSNV